MKAVAEYIHSMLALSPRQGMPPPSEDAGRAQHPRRRCRRGRELLRGEVQRPATRRPATCRASRRGSPMPRRCRTSGCRAARPAGAAAAARGARRRPARRTRAPSPSTVTLPRGEKVEGRLLRARRLPRLADRWPTARSAASRRRRRDSRKSSSQIPLEPHRKLLADLHRQGHARRDGLPGDPEMTDQETAARAVPRC